MYKRNFNSYIHHCGFKHFSGAKKNTVTYNWKLKFKNNGCENEKDLFMCYSIHSSIIEMPKLENSHLVVQSVANNLSLIQSVWTVRTQC